MGSYEKIVETLRRCAKEIDCDGCPYYHEDGYWCDQKSIATDAAAAIEALEARLGEAENSVERWKDMYLTKHEPKRGEWLPIIEGNEYGEPIQIGVVCSRCGEPFQYEPEYCPECGSHNAAKMEVQE